MKRKRKYTEAVHARRVRKVIEKKRPRNHCPAQPRYVLLRVFDAWEESQSVICGICKDFIGLESSIFCPCGELGEKEAVKRTRQALKKKGYL